MSNSIEPAIDIDFLWGIGIGIDIDFSYVGTIDIGIDIDFFGFWEIDIGIDIDLFRVNVNGENSHQTYQFCLYSRAI